MINQKGLASLMLIILLVVVGGGAFFLGKSLPNEQPAKQLSITSKKTKNISSPSPSVNPLWSDRTLKNVIKNSRERGFRVLAPTAEEKLCLGQYYNIKWEAPEDVKTAELLISEAGYNAEKYNLGTFPADYENGTFRWRVGFTKGILYKPDQGTKELLPRPGYKITMISEDTAYVDESDLFTITTCSQ